MPAAETTQAGVRFLEEVLEDLGRGLESGYTYTHERARTESFMLAGNGPSAWARFLLDDEGDVRLGYIEYSDGGGTVLVPVPDNKAEELLRTMRQDATWMDR